MQSNEKHFFDSKGKNAEKFLYELANNTFLNQWSFLNPKLPNGKELCDLLIVFDDIVIIWQNKDIKINEDGEYSKKHKNKNFRQINGARRELFELKTKIILKNEYRTIYFDVSLTKKIFLISTFTGESEICVSPIEEIKKHNVHIFTGKSIPTLLCELDTINDFVSYLREREIFFTSRSSNVIFGDEEDLLACYLVNNKRLPIYDDPSIILVISDYWNEFFTSPEYLHGKRENEISYFWDRLINKSKGKIEDVEKYERFTRVLAKLSRFQRRVLGHFFLEAQYNSAHGKCFRRIFLYENVVYCFFFDKDSKPEDRLKYLSAICWIAKGMFPGQSLVVGIATESLIQPKKTYDFVLIDNLKWTQEDQNNSVRLQKELGFFIECEVKSF